MNPSDVRGRVLAEHLWLSEKLTLVEASAAAVLSGRSAESARLRDRCRNLCESLWFHLATEDEILVPLLRSLDAWGEVRVERVQNDHQTQRVEIGELRRQAEEADPTALAEDVLTFAKALRADMANEEQVSLSRELLRDDAVALDQLDG
ncbi:MAG TPA: hemerythrin domain-containing protein [Myxococcaceae bacterium]|nr:hemerythrin domain-containing protein [Myxococcaceae bacterium]